MTKQELLNDIPALIRSLQRCVVCNAPATARDVKEDHYYSCDGPDAYCDDHKETDDKTLPQARFVRKYK